MYDMGVSDKGGGVGSVTRISHSAIGGDVDQECLPSPGTGLRPTVTSPGRCERRHASPQPPDLVPSEPLHFNSASVASISCLIMFNSICVYIIQYFFTSS